MRDGQRAADAVDERADLERERVRVAHTHGCRKGNDCGAGKPDAECPTRPFVPVRSEYSDRVARSDPEIVQANRARGTACEQLVHTEAERTVLVVKNHHAFRAGARQQLLADVLQFRLGLC